MASRTELYDLAVRYHQSGNLEQAEALYQQILQADPRQADVLNNMGVLRYEQKRLPEAEEYYRQALAANSQHVDAQNNLGVALKDQGHLGKAIECYRQTIRINPQYADAHNNLGVALRENGQVAEAIASYRQALALNPRHASALNNLGVAYQDLDRLAEAIACHRQALALNPHHAETLNSLGYALFRNGEDTEALTYYRQALQVAPYLAEVHNNLGIALYSRGHFAEAATCYENTLRCDPCHRIAIWNRSVLRLLQGDFAGGWSDYEQRWARPGLVPRAFRQPRWDGSPLAGKTILVHAEQGLGDTIQFVRYLPVVQDLGGKVVLECHPSLVKLFTDLQGPEVIVPFGTELPSFDVQVSLLSLPGHFGTTLATIPAEIPYLGRAARHQPASRMPRVAFGSPLNVGIAWQGNPHNPKDRYRSIPLILFEILTTVKDVRLMSLQVGSGTEQLAAAPFRITDLGGGFDPHSLEDLATALTKLDLVITVDSAVAHLAGALGAPVWTLLPYVPDWRWLLDRSDSPWYPTMRLYRQKQPGDWGEVIARVAGDLGSANRS